jgi:hypothetical protein
MAIPNTDIRLISVKLETLRPTQMTVGYREVSEKRAHWKTLGKRLREGAEGGARLCARCQSTDPGASRDAMPEGILTINGMRA